MLVQALRKVFSKFSYLLLSIMTGVAIFTFVVWLPNIRLIATVVSSSNASFYQKLSIPFSLFGSISTNFSPLSAMYTIAISMLFGLNIAALTYLLRHKVGSLRQGGVTTGFFGVMSGLIGVGCAACGAFLLTTGLAFIGASGIVALLPFAGGEFGILGVILLGISLRMTARQIQNPAVCRDDY